ncbi:MAG: C69 family dipeptidase [Bryobacteraceae bacterium]|nr:C69 family dipeptidase [Bryobacteraceae bacterium]
MRHRAIWAAAATLIAASPAWASYGIYVGKDLTADGSVFLAGYGDEPSSHWLEIVPAKEWPAGATIKVGATASARYPGELIEIPQVARTAKYITMNYSSFAGFPAPLTNGGLNEYHLAARDIWSPSREELRTMTPNPQRGLNYSDLSRIVMERARTAREAVEIVGALVNRYGYATYGGNSHMFADADEGWVLIEFAGGNGLWAAERLGRDRIRVSRPGYIGEIPLDYMNHPDYRGSPNLVSFAVEQGWYDPKAGAPFNLNKVYGDGKMRHDAVELIETRLQALAGKITLADMIAAVRAAEVTRDSAGYGQVARLRKTPHPELGAVWVAGATSVTAPFIPYCLGVADAPPEYKRHRYLTSGESDGFMDPEWQGVESTQYAFQVFKRLFYLASEHRERFLPEVTAALNAFEGRLAAAQPAVERTALKLFESGEPELARSYLTYYSNTEAMNGLRLAEALSASIEARTKAIFGVRTPPDASR